MFDSDTPVIFPIVFTFIAIVAIIIFGIVIWRFCVACATGNCNEGRGQFRGLRISSAQAHTLPVQHAPLIGGVRTTTTTTTHGAQYPVQPIQQPVYAPTTQPYYQPLSQQQQPYSYQPPPPYSPPSNPQAQPSYNPQAQPPYNPAVQAPYNPQVPLANQSMQQSYNPQAPPANSSVQLPYNPDFQQPAFNPDVQPEYNPTYGHGQSCVLPYHQTK